MQDDVDADAVDRYGWDEPTFGGVYFDGEVLVALFTANLDEHHARLVPLLRTPDQFRVAAADRPYAEVEAANRRVQQALIHSGRPHPEVTAVGIGMADRRFVICVGAENLTDELADAIRATVAPDVIVVEPGQRARRG